VALLALVPRSSIAMALGRLLLEGNASLFKRNKHSNPLKLESPNLAILTLRVRCKAYSQAQRHQARARSLAAKLAGRCLFTSTGLLAISCDGK